MNNCSTWNTKKNMRKVTEIIVHCADTPEGRDDKAADIDRWHRQRGFDRIGYHYVVDLDGTIEPGRDLECVGAHCKGHNVQSVGVCYIGGADKNLKPIDTRTPEQKAALRLLLKFLRAKYPDAKIYGHRDFSDKPCPCFDAKTEYANI